MSQLFSPVRFGPLSLDNRIVIPPMCQYSAFEGRCADWHGVHYGGLACSGAGLLILEATAVEPRGRISHADLGLWDDETETALSRMIASIRTYSRMPLGIQLAHAGRKGSMGRPWEGEYAIAPDASGGWRTLAPSALPFEAQGALPEAMSADQIAAVVAAFRSAAVRAVRSGLDLIELHAAHGYLLHQFLSPLSNHRTDDYGGSLDNRMRLTLQVLDAIGEAVQGRVAVGVRISASDWVAGGWDLAQSVELAGALAARGADVIHVSSGGLSPHQKIPLGPGYQVAFAETIRRVVPVPVIAVGLITAPSQAEQILVSGQADAVAIGRGMLYDPRWPWRAAVELGETVQAPPQYWRGAPQTAKRLFGR